MANPPAAPGYGKRSRKQPAAKPGSGKRITGKQPAAKPGSVPRPREIAAGTHNHPTDRAGVLVES